MKLILSFLVSALLMIGTYAQKKPEGEMRSMEVKKLQAMEMAFITKELNLTPDEAQKFWPVFNLSLIHI